MGPPPVSRCAEEVPWWREPTKETGGRGCKPQVVWQGCGEATGEVAQRVLSWGGGPAQQAWRGTPLCGLLCRGAMACRSVFSSLLW